MNNAATLKSFIATEEARLSKLLVIAYPTDEELKDIEMRKYWIELYQKRLARLG